jgi:DNA polymerase
MSLDELKVAIQNCNLCGLCSTRTNTVPGEGNTNADIMIIGEGPGQNEDEQGRPFVGRSGQLLDRMIKRCLNLERSDVFITNIVKCRPPNRS